MTERDGSEAMDPFRNLSERQLDELFEGRSPGGSQEFDALAALLRDLRRSNDGVDATVAAMHIAATATEAGHHQPNPVPVGTPATGRRYRRPITVFTALFSTLFGKIAFGVAGATIAFGGAGVAGVLPDPVQTTLADISSMFPDGEGDISIDTDDCSFDASSDPSGADMSFDCDGPNGDWSMDASQDSDDDGCDTDTSSDSSSDSSDEVSDSSTDSSSDSSASCDDDGNVCDTDSSSDSSSDSSDEGSDSSTDSSTDSSDSCDDDDDDDDDLDDDDDDLDDDDDDDLDDLTAE